MSQIKISQLPGASGLTGTESIPAVQNGVTVKTSVQDIADLANPYDYTPENVANKSTNVNTDATSDVKYPSVKAIKDYTDGIVVGVLSDQGNWDASGNLFPSTRTGGGAIQKGDLWYISVGGTLGATVVYAGYSIRALAATPGQTASNWGILNVGIGYTPENVANKSTDVALGTSDTLYPTQNAVKTYVENAIEDVSLQNVTAGVNRNLTSGNNFQGTNTGPTSTAGKSDINAFGTDAASLYTGLGNLNAFGNGAANNSSGASVNAIGALTAASNSGSHVNAFGDSAALGNSGNNVNAFGNQAGVLNTYGGVNLFGPQATADGPNQTVFNKDGLYNARMDFGGITFDRKYTLPDDSGTLALTSQITIPTLSQVTIEGNVAITDIISENNFDNKIEAKHNSNSSSAALTQDGAKGKIVLKNSTGATTTIQPSTPGSSTLTLNLPNTTGTVTLATQSELTLQNVTAGSNKNLTNGNNFQGTDAGASATGTNKILLGASAGKLNNAGSDVVAIGQNAGAYTSTGATVNFGADNVLIGQYAGGIDGASGTYNVGVQNVMIGKNAGRNSRGEKNVLIGFESGLATSNNGCVSLNSGSLTGNSQFSVGNASYGGTARGFRIDFSTVTGTRALTLPTVDGELLTKNQTTIVRKTSLSAAQVQALSTTAQQIIPAPGTGKIAVLKSLTIKGNTPAGSVYSTNNNLRIRYTNTTLVAALTGVLGSYFNVSNIPDLVVPDEANLPTNNDISIFTLGGNPAGGSTGFDFIAEYIIIE